MTVEELIVNYPNVYHMAESGTWPSIQRHGLLSTLALLDLFEIKGGERKLILEKRRPEKVAIRHPVHGIAVIRDQKPMSEGALRKCLEDGLTPEQWCNMLNRRVFFWPTEERLTTLLGARAYRDEKHCVLTINTAALLLGHAARVTLSPINSGSTVYTPQQRGLKTFLPIASYPFQERRRTRSVKAAIAEIVVDYSVPNIAGCVVRVEERHGPNVVKSIFEREIGR